MLIDRENWRLHRGWVLATAAATALAVAWYAGEAVRSESWPGGSSLPGFTFGALGGIVILFELLLYFRKKVRAWRLGRAQVWMRAHIWLGLLCLPLLVLHSGFRLGGTLSAVLMVLLVVVIASGIWGLALQQFLPSRLLNEVPAETIYSQMDYVVGQLTEEASRLVRGVCGPAEGEEAAAADDRDAAQPAGVGFLVVGAVRTAGHVRGRVLATEAAAAPVAGSEPLREFFLQTVKPFLADGAASGSPLRLPKRAAVMFDGLRTRVDPAAHAAVAALEDLCEQRRQLDHQARLHGWLHNWLWVHLPLSVALVVLMAIHAWAALRYW